MTNVTKAKGKENQNKNAELFLIPSRLKHLSKMTSVRLFEIREEPQELKEWEVTNTFKTQGSPSLASVSLSANVQRGPTRRQSTNWMCISATTAFKRTWWGKAEHSKLSDNQIQYQEALNYFYIPKTTRKWRNGAYLLSKSDWQQPWQSGTAVYRRWF